MRQADFLTAHGDIPMSVWAMTAGAVAWLTEPVRDQALSHAIGRPLRATCDTPAARGSGGVAPP
jgi:FixJ family two-component response regulator